MDSNYICIKLMADHQRGRRIAWDLWRRKVWAGAKDHALRGNVLGPGQQKGSGSTLVLPAQLTSLPIHEAKLKACQQNLLSKETNVSHPASLVPLLPSFQKAVHDVAVMKHWPLIPPKSTRFKAGPNQMDWTFPPYVGHSHLSSRLSPTEHDCRAWILTTSMEIF